MQDNAAALTGTDAEEHLHGTARAPREIGSSPLAYKDDECLQAFCPWRRFLARMLDVSIYNLLWSVMLIFAFHVNLATRSRVGNMFDGFVALGMMLLLEPVWLCVLASTPGKAIFGLKISTPEGRRLAYGQGFRRTWAVIGAGMGYNIPIYNLIRLWKSYRLSSENETQPWDECVSYTIKDTKGHRAVLLVGAYAAIFVALFTAMSAQQLPPNRGDLTVAEFVENYHYYARLYDIDFGSMYLDTNGQWREKAFDGTAYIRIGHTPVPEYDYTVEDGSLTGISFVVDLEDHQDWLGSYDTQMILASLALIGAQDEVKLFTKAPSQIVERIRSSTFDDFEFIGYGIEADCRTEYSGYMRTQAGFLVPEENAAEHYFGLHFAVNKLE